MAVPRLASLRPFFRLDPQHLSSVGIPVADLASAKNAARYASSARVEDMPIVDLIVCGTVAVNLEGVRIGKGAGYSDIEVGLLAEAGLITERTTIVTTVHSSQVLDEELPRAEHDFTVDYIVTPEATIACGNPYRPDKSRGSCPLHSQHHRDHAPVPLRGAASLS
ncbi:MAG: 5-formyltetrahydrofolate cyclo-ligase [Micromonosporaceae bacterium]